MLRWSILPKATVVYLLTHSSNSTFISFSSHLLVLSAVECSVFQKEYLISPISVRPNISTVLYQNYLPFSFHFFILAFLTFHLKDFATETWIGLNDINHEMRFLWTDGTGVYFTNWAKGFPSGHMGLYAYSGQVNSNHKLFTEIWFYGIIYFGKGF